MAMFLGSSQVSKAYVGSTQLAGIIIKGNQILGLPGQASDLSEITAYIVEEANAGDILWASNSPNDWTPSMGFSTSGTWADLARVSGSLNMADNTVYSMRDMHPESSTDDTWYKFRIIFGNYGHSQEDGYLGGIRDASGVLVARFNLQDGGFTAQAVGDTTVTGAIGAPIPKAIFMELAMRVTVTAASIVSELWFNGSMVSTATAANTVGGKGKPRKMDLDTNDLIYATLSTCNISEIIVSEQNPSLNRLTEAQPVAIGSHSDILSGTVGNVKDRSDATFIAFDEDPTDGKVSFTSPAYGNSATISAVVVRAKVRTTTEGEEDKGAIFVSPASAGYNGPDIGLTASFVWAVQSWANSPATNVAWTSAEVAAMEFGYQNGGLVVTVPQNLAFKSKALQVLGSQDGFAIDFVGKRMIVNDSVTEANEYDGDPEALLTKNGADAYQYNGLKGLVLDGARDFGLGLDVTKVPYDKTAIHVYARYELDAATDADLRYLINVFNDTSPTHQRFAMYAQATDAFMRMVTSDRVITDTDTASGIQTIVADTEYESFFGADDIGRTWFINGDVQVTDDALLKLDAKDDADNGFIGIGGHGDVVSRVLGGHLAEICVIFGDIEPRLRQTVDPFSKLYSAEGDSHTYNVSFGMDKREFYPYRAAGMLEGYREFNSGASGESSFDMLADVGTFLAQGTPDLASIYAGSNDTSVITVVDIGFPANSVSIVTVDDITALNVDEWVVINGETVQIASISEANSYIALTIEDRLSTPAGPGDLVKIGTQKHIEEWIQAVNDAGTPLSRIYVVGAHYLNFASGGDTTTVEQTLRATIRAAELAAATAKGVEYIDTYAYAAALITAGDVVQGDWAVWHQGATDTHLTADGEQMLADAILAGLS